MYEYDESERNSKGAYGIWEEQGSVGKILGIAIYIQTSSVRRTAKILSELHSVSKSAWIKKFEERLP